VERATSAMNSVKSQGSGRGACDRKAIQIAQTLRRDSVEMECGGETVCKSHAVFHLGVTFHISQPRQTLCGTLTCGYTVATVSSRQHARCSCCDSIA